MASAAAHDGGVVGDREDLLARVPGVAGVPGAVGRSANGAAKADPVGEFRPLELPRVAEGEPVFRQLLLHAVDDLLLEQAVIVADAVAERVDLQRRHALHEAGGETAETAIAEGGVRLALAQLVEIDALQRQRLADGIGQAQIADRVGEQAADQELERQIIDSLGRRIDRAPP